MDAKIAHLQMIQAVIQRMANSSFVIRGWTVTLVAGVFAISAKDAERLFFLIAYLPIISFWLLDGFYLSREKTFRAMYDDVATKADTEINFEMDNKAYGQPWPNACFSITPLLFYGVLAVSTLVLMFSL